MQFKSFSLCLLLSAVSVHAAVNEPCYGSGGRAGMTCQVQLFVCTNTSRRMRNDSLLLRQWRNNYRRCLSSRRFKRQVLHQGQLWQWRKLPLDQRLCWNLSFQSLPRPSAIQVLLVFGHGLRRIRCAHNPSRWRLQAGGCQRRPRYCQCLAWKNKEHWLCQRLCLSW
jgi:hypothetical protein